MINQKYLIAVVDGQGGGIGRQCIERLTKCLPKELPVVIRALGTNGFATAAMLKAGASDGATGENAIIHNVKRADIIMGPFGISIPHAMLGELSPAIAEAIGASDALRILIPFDGCNTKIVVINEGTLQQYIERAVEFAINKLQEYY